MDRAEQVTAAGENRARYAARVPGDPRPSRFTGTTAYAEWAARADAWAAAGE